VRLKVSDVRKKTTARVPAARLRKVAAPRPPKRVWLDPAPNVPARPPPFPDWSRMATIKETQARTWSVVMKPNRMPDMNSSEMFVDACGRPA
jgi:hypothetical protein